MKPTMNAGRDKAYRCSNTITAEKITIVFAGKNEHNNERIIVTQRLLTLLISPSMRLMFVYAISAKRNFNTGKI